ncbi:ABC transporter ATP-binding protein [Agrobacterium tumefaciens]|uniref:ABC transporter ATP-binding protein n=1 Tax=Agrobacterium tumefaciens TaxID=358 RepID=UPI00097733AB|nr:sugar ABC transporter ATP-binding protein [Agrobacterium tumefaciens]
MVAVELIDIRKNFGSLDVIKGVNLSIASGEFVVFVGPSGCGKSTLLRMIAGLEDITSGTFTIGGKRMNDVDPSGRGIGMVFQSYALYPHMTVRQNMGFALRFAGMVKSEIESRVDVAGQTLGLGPLMNRKPKELSGGQRQRVAIGRAIVRDPDVFLFDEPLSNLDAELRVHMRVEIAKLHKAMKTTIIYVTHDQVEAMTLADKIVVLRAGLVEQVGKPLDLYNDPANTFVAGFIGSPRMNFMKARIVGRENARLTVALVSQPDVRLVFPVSDDGYADTKNDVSVGIRPEHFVPPGQGDADLVTTVDVAEHLGSTSFVYAHLSAEERIVIQSDSSQLDGGQSLTVGLAAQTSFLFDASGLRIR